MDVVCLALVRNSQLLVCRRAPHKSLGGYWELPGGKVEKDESEIEALMREIKEELEIEILPEREIASSADGQLTLKSFLARSYKGELKLGSDHDSHRWLSLEELHMVDWAPLDIPHLAYVAKLLI